MLKSVLMLQGMSGPVCQKVSRVRITGRPRTRSKIRGVQQTRSLGGFWEGGRHWSEVTADDAIDFLGEAKAREYNQLFSTWHSMLRTIHGSHLRSFWIVIQSKGLQYPNHFYLSTHTQKQLEQETTTR